MKKLLFGILFTIVIINTIHAQDTIVSENRFFQSVRVNQENSYITFGQGVGNLEPLIFEGLIAPYFLIRTSKDAKWVATLSPAILLRMQSKYSFPVESPSYMPNITFYRQLSNCLTENDKSKYLFLKLQHHSNGQDGKFFNDDGSFNTRTGDFSTNFIEAGFFINQRIVPVKGTSEFFKTSLEYHFNYDRSSELEGIYSFFRWHNNFRIFKFSFPALKSLFSSQKNFKTGIPKIETKYRNRMAFRRNTQCSFF